MLHPLYPIVPDAGWVARLVPLGVRTVQLRAKNLPRDETLAHIRDSLELCRAHGAQLIVNDYWEEAIALGADYVHLGQEDLAAADLAAIRAAGMRLGVSTHSHDELQIALAAKPDYVALGPVYETTLKKMKWAPQGLAKVAEWKRLVPCPLVAIGGISLERSEAVFEAGADAIAVVTDIVMRPDWRARTQGWLSLIAARGK